MFYFSYWGPIFLSIKKMEPILFLKKKGQVRISQGVIPCLRHGAPLHVPRFRLTQGLALRPSDNLGQVPNPLRASTSLPAAFVATLTRYLTAVTPDVGVKIQLTKEFCGQVTYVRFTRAPGVAQRRNHGRTLSGVFGVTLATLRNPQGMGQAFDERGRRAQRFMPTQRRQRTIDRTQFGVFMLRRFPKN